VSQHRWPKGRKKTTCLRGCGTTREPSGETGWYYLRQGESLGSTKAPLCETFEDFLATPPVRPDEPYDP
jgi:hypothetical protein